MTATCRSRGKGLYARRWALGALVVLLLGWPARAEEPAAGLPSPVLSPEAWQDWFFGQRRYGLGYIPEEALPRAVAQRDSLPQRRNFQTQSTNSGEKTLSADRWSGLGPGALNSLRGDVVTGRITSLAMDPRNSSTLYAAAAGGGVWKTTNGGARWAPLTDQLPSLASGAVAVDPFSGEVWYGTGELNFCRDCYYGAGIYRSPDGGANWSRVAADTFLSSPTSVIVFDRRNQGTLFIGRSTALWKSADGGRNWRAILRGVVTDFVFNPADSSVAYAAMGNFSGSPDNGIYRTTDGGENWVRLSAGLPPQAGMGRIALAVAPSDPSAVYALIVRSSDFNLNGLYRSLDGGENWSLIETLPSSLFLEDGRGQGLFNLFVKVHPRDPAILYVGGIDLWKSTNFGASWQDLSAAAGLHEDQRDIVFDPADPQRFYLINDSGVWRSSDGGQSFASLNSTLDATQFQTVGLHPTNPNLAVGGTQDNGTILYRGSFAWEQGRAGDSGAAFYDPFNPQTVFTVANRLSLRRSDDGGRSFRVINEGISPTDRVLFYPPFLPDPGQPGVLYFATQRVWQTRDGGEHWTPLSGDLTRGGSGTISALAVAPGDSQVLYAGTSDGSAHASLDGGRSWSPAGPLPNRFVTSIAVHPHSPHRAFLGLSGFGTGHVFRTDDRGGRWEDISANLPDIPVNAVLVDAVSPDTLYVGTDIGVFVLSPDGNWVPLTQGMPNAIVLGLSQNPATGLLVAATHGRGAFALALREAAAQAPRMDFLLNAAGFGNAPLAPGMMVSLFGSALAEAPATPTNPFPFPSLFPLPEFLGGVSVSVNGVLAPLFFVSPAQVNFLVPYGVEGPMAEVTLRRETGEASARVRRTEASPGIFQNGAAGIIVHGNNVPVSESNPARPGEQLVLYASGLGAVQPAVRTGSPSPFSPVATTVAAPRVRVAGAAAEVRFSGLTPSLIGLYQINFVVPPGVSGTVPVVVEMDGASSNSALLAVLP